MLYHLNPVDYRLKKNRRVYVLEWQTLHSRTWSCCDKHQTKEACIGKVGKQKWDNTWICFLSMFSEVTFASKWTPAWCLKVTVFKYRGAIINVWKKEYHCIYQRYLPMSGLSSNECFHLLKNTGQIVTGGKKIGKQLTGSSGLFKIIAKAPFGMHKYCHGRTVFTRLHSTKSSRKF